MNIRFCPGCASVLGQVTLVVAGVPTLFWECPEGDWLEPVAQPSQESQEEAEATPDGAA